MIKTCEVCGEKFKARYSWQKFCSSQCRRIRSRDKQRDRRGGYDPDLDDYGELPLNQKLVQRLVCKECGCVFWAKHKRFYCSDFCKQKANRRNALNRYYRLKENAA